MRLVTVSTAGGAAGSEPVEMNTWVRCRSDGLHDLVCDHCGFVAYEIRDYRAALRAASEHKNKCNHEKE
jgi:hypothetical protein